jgi:DNA-binding transcriptional MerR regulator
MTISEVSERYKIPVQRLKEYKKHGLCPASEKSADTEQYDNTDIERLSLITTLNDVGFELQEIKTYLLLMQREETENLRLSMLERKRSLTLDEIHLRERQLTQLDYIRHTIRKKQEENKQINKEAARL